MLRTVRNATVLGLGLSASAIIGWLLLRESKRSKDTSTVTIRSQAGNGPTEAMQPIVLPREALEATADEQAGYVPRAGADDFTHIRGIGPRFAEALYQCGITTFAALASETPDSLAEKLAPYVTIRPQRIRDFDWIGQAKARAASA